MSATIDLPAPDGAGRQRLTLREPRDVARPDGPLRSRRCFAAAHVVADPLAENGPGRPAALDWSATLAFREHLWSYGLGVAEAMDTAQRGMGLDWPTARTLIGRSAELARDHDGMLCAGANTDHAGDGALRTLDDVAAAYEEQVAAVEDAGAEVVLMASRDLARIADGPDDYLHVYGRLLGQVRRPVILHWLGAVFDPALEGYWGSDAAAALDTVVGLVEEHRDVIDGIKVSLLDADAEVRLRNRVPSGVRVYTGDDFHYPELIRGDADGSSDALLGVFAAIAPAASAAVQALDRGDPDAFDAWLEPTLPLARHLFTAPTRFYKTGIAFLAWLSGIQAGFVMVGGLHGGRDPGHLVEVLRLADAAGVLPDPELAAARMRAFLQVHGLAA